MRLEHLLSGVKENMSAEMKAQASDAGHGGVDDPVYFLRSIVTRYKGRSSPAEG